MAKPDGLPPWIARNARERRWMERWVVAKLDAIIADADKEFGMPAFAALGRLSPETRRAFLTQHLADSRERLDADSGRHRRDLAIDAAAHGNIGPLRQEVAKVDPRYRRYVNLPRLKRGQHFKKRPPFDARQYWLEEARKDGVWIACSLRDILVRRPDQDEYEARVCDIARKYFDLVLVHGDPRFQVLDESFSRVADLGCPVVYTGYVHRGVKRGKPAGCASLSGRPTIVGSIGAGKCESGHHLLDALISAAAVLEHDLPHQFEIFTGPFMAEHDYARLAARVADLRNVTLSSYTPDLAGHLSRSDLSVSMGGYNTVMDVLAANVRALVYPVIGNGDNEQRVRAEKLAASGALEIIETADLLPERLAGKIRAALQRAAQPVSLDMDGARKTRELIHAHLGVCSR